MNVCLIDLKKSTALVWPICVLPPVLIASDPRSSSWEDTCFSGMSPTSVSVELSNFKDGY